MGRLTWSETMRGSLGRGERERRARFDIDVAVADVDAFLADPGHRAAVTGTVHVDGLTGPDGRPVTEGAFQLLVETGDPRAREMIYTLPFDAAGERWTLHGVKDVRGKTPGELWRASTRLAATLRRGEREAEAEASGTLGLGAADVARLGISMRPLAPGRFLASFTRTLASLLAAGRDGR